MNDKRLCTGAAGLAAYAAAGAVGLQLLTELARQNSLPALLGWLPGHLLPFLAGALVLGLALAGLALLTRRLWPGLLAVGLALFAGSYAGFFKQAYRGDPLLPADLLLARDAAGIMEGLDLRPTWSLAAFGVVLAVACWLLRRERLCLPGRRAALAGAGLTAAAAVWAGVCFGPGASLLRLEPQAGEPGALYDKGGFTAGFLTYLCRIQPQKPAGYSADAARQALAQLPADDSPASTPDIVVVMMESYYHLDNYPGLTGCEDLTANYDRLAAEGVSGCYYSDKYSGGTADMEFGALTGFSTAFLPEGVVPYMQYVASREQFPAYPAWLQSLGYRTIAIHPFDGDIYSRTDAYRAMGFDTFVDRDSMTHTDLAGQYIADAAAAAELIDQYQAAAQDGPVFLHMVTMQNHIPNLPEEYPADSRVQASLPGLDDYYQGSLESVATGLRDADEMMKTITDYFRTVDREVIVLFFGDHQTAIGQQGGVELLDVTGGLEGLSDWQLRRATHRVPYLMWSNRGCDEAGSTAGSFPSYLLLPAFLEKMDAPMTGWMHWLAQSRQLLGGVTGRWQLDTDGQPLTDPTQEQTGLLRTQQILQYARMFDGTVSGDPRW